MRAGLAKLSVRIAESGISRPIARSVHAMSWRMRIESSRPRANSGVSASLAGPPPGDRSWARASGGPLRQPRPPAPVGLLQVIDHAAPVLAHHRRAGTEH